MHTNQFEAFVGKPLVTIVTENNEVINGLLRHGRDRGWYMLHASRGYIPLWHEDYESDGNGGLVHVRAVNLENSTVAETPDPVYRLQPDSGGTRVPVRHRDDRQDAHVLRD